MEKSCVGNYKKKERERVVRSPLSLKSELSATIAITTAAATDDNNELHKTYTYVGIEGDGISNRQMMDTLVQEYYRRVRNILRTEN